MTNLAYYNTGRLMQKLDKISEVPITIIAAPAGSGKATIAYDQVRRLNKKTIWLDCEGAAKEESYSRLCHAFSKVNTDIGNKLESMGFPTNSNSYDIANVLLHEEFVQTEEHVLVIDNFHVLQPVLTDVVLSALVNRRGGGLQIIILTDYLWSNFIPELSSALLITSDDLSMNAEDIYQYFKSFGLEISDETAARLFELTNGWNVAVHLYYKGWGRHSQNLTKNSIHSLIENLIWNPYDEAVKEAFLMFIPFKELDGPAIKNIVQDESSLEKIHKALRSNPLVSYNPISRFYYQSEVFVDFVQEKLRMRSEDFQEHIFYQAGMYFLSINNITDALQCFDKACAYEKILQLNHRNIYQIFAGDSLYTDIVERVIENTDAEMRANYPAALLGFAYMYLGIGDLARVLSLCREVLEHVGLDGDQILLGEAKLIESFGYMPDLKKMNEKLEEADVLFGNAASVIVPETLFLSGCPSMLSVFLQQPGTADMVASELEKAMAIYSKLTHGHGSGADLLYRGGLALQRGQYEDALIFAYKAEHMAQKNNQLSIICGAALLRGNVASALKDDEAYQEAVACIEGLEMPVLFGVKPKMFQNMISTALAYLQAGSRYREEKAKYTPGLKLFPIKELYPVIKMLDMFYAKMYTKLIGVFEVEECNMALCGIMHSIYSNLLAGGSYSSINKIEKGNQLIRFAYQTALQDKLLLPFSEAIEAIYPYIPEELRINKDGGNVSFSGKETNETGIDAKDSDKDPSIGSLTPRERELAKLASEGMQNKEIAELLFLSEGTVRNHLSIVYQKLGIQRRHQLMSYKSEL